jgi:hypothetical protein
MYEKNRKGKKSLPFRLKSENPLHPFVQSNQVKKSLKIAKNRENCLKPLIIAFFDELTAFLYVFELL